MSDSNLINSVLDDIATPSIPTYKDIKLFPVQVESTAKLKKKKILDSRWQNLEEIRYTEKSSGSNSAPIHID
jgi:hypothetical protein